MKTTMLLISATPISEGIYRGGDAMYHGKPGSLGSTSTQFGSLHGTVEMIDVQKGINDLCQPTRPDCETTTDRTRSMRRPPLPRRLLIIPAVAATAVAPAAAIAHSTDSVAAAKKPPTSKIVLGKSVAGISLGMPRAQVKHLLGKPDIGKPALVYLDAGLVVGFGHNKVDFVGAAKSRYRTSKGIHTGSSRAAVKRAYPQVRCKKTKVGKLKELSCRLASGSTSTEFTMNQSGRTVATIDVSRP